MFYWAMVCGVSDVREPWDASGFAYVWYPLSIAGSAIAGCRLGHRGWLAGLAMTFSQLPLWWLQAGIGPMIGIGLPFLAVLAIPPAMVASLVGRLSAAAHARRSR